MFTHIRTRRLVLLAGPFVAVGLMAAAANADTIRVCWDGSGDHETIQEGIDAAQDGDEVVVCDGVYTGPGNKDLVIEGKVITVRSASGNPDTCVIDCRGEGCGFAIWGHATNAPIVDGLTIRNGYLQFGIGLGILCVDSSPTITNCVITDMTAAFWGGGIACLQEGNATIENSVITHNTADRGGGIYCEQSNVTISNCWISGNSSGTADGGVMLTGGGATMTNCVIAQNTADQYGGGIWCAFAGVTLSNCAIVGNTANQPRGGGVYWLDSGGGITNCILWNNQPQQIWVNPPAPTVGYCDIQGGWSGQGNISADPRFGTEYHLRSGSPCIDAGCNGGVPPDTADLDDDGDVDEPTPFDLDGEGRFFDDPDTPDTGCGFVPIVDMGAYEFGDAGPQACPGDMDGDRDVDHSDLGVLLSLWGATDQCDLDCDGDIDQGDLGILLGHWGEGCP